MKYVIGKRKNSTLAHHNGLICPSGKNDMLNRVLNSTDEQGITTHEAIVMSLAEKARNGDLNAIKYLRELTTNKEEEIPEIKITVVD